MHQNTIEQEAQKIATLATKENICLPFDDPLALLIHPDRTWELMVLDLGDTREGKDPDPDLKPTLREQNEALVTKFLQNIEINNT